MSDTDTSSTSTTTNTKIEPLTKQEKVKMYNKVYYEMNKEQISQRAKEKYDSNEAFRKIKRERALKHYYEKKAKTNQVG
jgi:hypothetical protein